jgi:hypothetical protein
VQHMLGHASLEQTSTYLNATLRGLHHSMRAFDQVRARSARQELNPSVTGNSCNLVASDPPATLWLTARTRRLPPIGCW